MDKTLTICIPAYENAEALERAIHSIKKQTFSTWECIIGDDSESDALQELVKKVADPRITYFRNTPPKGVPGNWNALIAQATGTYVTLLHQDDFYVQDTALESVFSALSSSGSRFAVCAYGILEKEKMTVHCTDGGNIRRFLQDFPQRSLIVNRIGHPSVVFFQNGLKDVLFDNDLCYFLDTDWYARLWKAGGEPVYVADAEIGVEKGSSAQVSQQCMLDFGSIDAELERALKKWNTSPLKTVTGFARLYASHVRHWARAWPALKQRLRSFSPGQRGVFGVACFILLWHMGYRAVRKYICHRPWA